MFNAIQPALRSHYAAHWREFVRPEELKKVTALAPAIGAFAYALIAGTPTIIGPIPLKYGHSFGPCLASKERT